MDRKADLRYSVWDVDEMSAQSEIKDILKKALDDHNRLLEEYCERMLVDPEGRGIMLIWIKYPLVYEFSLSHSVPWGSIYEVGAPWA